MQNFACAMFVNLVLKLITAGAKRRLLINHNIIFKKLFVCTGIQLCFTLICLQAECVASRAYIIVCRSSFFKKKKKSWLQSFSDGLQHQAQRRRWYDEIQLSLQNYIIVVVVRCKREQHTWTLHKFQTIGFPLASFTNYAKERTAARSLEYLQCIT